MGGGCKGRHWWGSNGTARLSDKFKFLENHCWEKAMIDTENIREL